MVRFLPDRFFMGRADGAPARGVPGVPTVAVKTIRREPALAEVGCSRAEAVPTEGCREG